MSNQPGAGIEFDATAPVARLRIRTGPENWLTVATFGAIAASIARAEADERVLALTLESGVDGVFSYGCDVTTERDTVDAESLIRAYVGVARQILKSRLIVVAGVDGVCVGGGYELVMLCTIVKASERTFFRLPEILIGCAPPIASAVYASRVGPATAFDHLLSGRKVTPVEARDLGIVSEVVPTTEFSARFERYLRDLAMVTRYPDTLRTILAQDPRRRIEEFDKRLESSLRAYRTLVEAGTIQAGVTEYWASKAKPPRAIQPTEQHFDLGWLYAS